MSNDDKQKRKCIPFFLLTTILLFSIAVYGYLVADTLSAILEVNVLKSRGVEVTGIVQEYCPRILRTGNFFSKYSKEEIAHFHLVSYDGYSQEIELDNKQYPGDKVLLLYDSEKPSCVWVGRSYMTGWQLWKQNVRVSNIPKGSWLGIVAYLSFGVVGIGAMLRLWLREIS